MSDSETMTAEDRLRECFHEAESLAGLKSIHGALVDMAQSGASGTRSPSSPESQWYDGRRYKVRRCREVRDWLSEIDTKYALDLARIYGQPTWPGPAPTRADENWHRRPPVGVSRLGDLALVALETRALRKAHAARPNATTLAATLEIACRAGGERFEAIEAESERRADAALAAFLLRSGLKRGSAPRVEKKRAKRAGDDYTAVRLSARVFGVAP